MSPKSKTQKRNEQKRKAGKNGKSGEHHNNKQQQELHRIAEQNKVLAKKQEMFEAAQRHFRDVMRATPGTPSYDPNFKMPKAIDSVAPSSASAPKIDEKYVKVPDVCETAVDQLLHLVEHTKFLQPENVSSKDQKTVATTRGDLLEKLHIVKDLIQKPDVKKEFDIPHHIINAISCTHQLHPLHQSRDGSSLKDFLHSLGNTRSGRPRLQPLHIKLSFDWGSQTSAANTANTFVARIRPNDASEFSNLASLYDEYMCTSAVLFWNWLRSTGTNSIHAAVAYDPVNAGTYGSVGQVIIASQHMGPVSSNQGSQAVPWPVNPHGVYKFEVKMPKGNQYEYGTVTGIATGSWTDVSVTAVDYGYFKFYIEASSGGGTTSIDSHQTMNVEFRSRS